MFKALKKLFTAEEKETEVQKNDEIEKYIEEAVESKVKQIDIFPESEVNIKAPVQEEVVTLANKLYEKSKEGDGLLETNENHLLYTKKYDFCTINWIIIDTRVEKRADLIKNLNKASREWNKKDPRPTTSADFIWYINTELLTNPLQRIDKNTTIIRFGYDIYKWSKESYDSPSELFSKRCAGIDLLEFQYPNEGYFSILQEVSKYRSYAICILFFEKKEALLNHRFYNHYSTYQDPFTNNTIFQWESIGTPSNEYLSVIREQLNKGFEPRPYVTLNHWLYFKLKNVNGVDYITFEFAIREIKLRADDAIYFLLSNGEVIEFRLPKKFYTIEPRELKGVDIPITQEELITLSKHELEKVRVHEKKSNFKVDIEITDYINKWDMYKDYRQYVIRNLFADHLEQVEKIIDGYKPLVGDEKTVDEQNNEPCHVYLMKDQANDFFKIGISNQPNYRERTLQSEKPTIDLIASKEFPSRTIAESIERALHDSYSDKRLRGEWFDLDPKDINDIKKTLK